MEQKLDSMEDIPSSEHPLEAVVNGEDIWHVLEATEIVQALQTSPKQGLSEDEASRRLEQFGPNELEEAEKPSLFSLIFEQFKNFIIMKSLGSHFNQALSQAISVSPVMRFLFHIPTPKLTIIQEL